MERISEGSKLSKENLGHNCLKNVRAKNFYNTDFFTVWPQSVNELPMSEMQKIWGVTNFVFEIKRVENSPNFDTSVIITRHRLSAYYLKNIKNASL